MFGPLRLRILQTTVKGREEDRESEEYRIGVKGKSRYLAGARKDGTQKTYIHISKSSKKESSAMTPELRGCVKHIGAQKVPMC